MGLYKRGSVWWMSFICEGKQNRKSTKTEDEALAQKIYETSKKQIVREEWFGEEEKDEEEQVTFDQLLDIYEKEEDAKTYILQFSRVYLNHFKGRKLSQIARKDLFEFKRIMKNTPKQRGGKEVTTSSVNRALAGLRRLLYLAVSRGYLKESPFPKESKSGLFYSEKKNRGRKRYYTESEMRKIIKASPDWLKPMIITAYLTGMRAGELLKMKWKDLNLEDGEILLESTKAGESQVVKMQDELVKLFKELPEKSEYVFCQENGEPLKHWHYRKPLKEALETIGKNEKGWNFHTIRHTTGTQLYLKGASPIAIKDQLRHSDIQVTTDFYVGRDPAFQKKQIEVLASIFQEIQPASA